MENNGNIKKAKQEFDEIQKDEYEQKMTKLRMKHIMDSKAIEEYGDDKGLQAGREEGKIDEKMKTAKQMLADGIDIETIKKYTGLEDDEIEKLN